MVGPRASRISLARQVGFAKDGRITAVDMFTIVEGGPYVPGGDGNAASRYASLMFQPESMRWRGITAITNTPPRGAQSSLRYAEHHHTRAYCGEGCASARHRIRWISERSTLPQARPDSARQMRGRSPYTTICFLKEALDKGRSSSTGTLGSEQPAAGGQQGARCRRSRQRIRRGSTGFRRLVSSSSPTAI